MSERNSLGPRTEPDLDEFAEPAAARPTPRRRGTAARPSLVWPVLLIGAGVALLLSEFGYLELDLGQLLWRYWSIILILVGVDLLFGRRSPLTTLLSVLLVVIVVGGDLAARQRQCVTDG